MLIYYVANVEGDATEALLVFVVLLVGCLVVLALAASIVESVPRVVIRVKKDEPTWFRRIFGE